MPTVFRSNGFIFVVYPNDHEPPHVHVFKAEAELIINLGSGGEDPKIREVYRMRSRDIATALTITRSNNDLFLESWKEFCE